MRSTALSYKDEYDEAPVSSAEVLEANVMAIREELKEHKADFKDFKTEIRAAIVRLDHDIKTSVADLRSRPRSRSYALRSVR